MYLTPDAEEALDTLAPDTTYVIGALVDRTVCRGASLTRARAHGICTRRLPTHTLSASTTKALNINAVVHAFAEFSHCRDWHVALTRALACSQRGFGKQ